VGKEAAAAAGNECGLKLDGEECKRLEFQLACAGGCRRRRECL
jgi:hypothetical protein